MAVTIIIAVAFALAVVLAALATLSNSRGNLDETQHQQ